MALYKNTRTGAVIDVQCEVGGDWIKVVSDSAEPEKKPAPVKPKQKRRKADAGTVRND